ncbi:MAG: hypothetical protein RSG52_01930 [Terrisporobacter sp.]|uniref:hypothetical protein n=1 Tax=Terrisporobacter sp. TaxID=1965305 RepID=UPI002FC6B594
MQNKNTIMASFFIATLGTMLIICGLIFIIYCFGYEIKNKKKLYKEAKLISVLGIIIGIVMLVGSLLYLSKNTI